jgi:hypothetical protein
MPDKDPEWEKLLKDTGGEHKKIPLEELAKKKNIWGRGAPHVLDALNDFLAGVRIVRPNFELDKRDISLWKGQMNKIISGRGSPKSGFFEWAVVEHHNRFQQQGKIVVFKGPVSVDYLWHEYEEADRNRCPKCGEIFCTCELPKEEYLTCIICKKDKPAERFGEGGICIDCEALIRDSKSNKEDDHEQ